MSPANPDTGGLALTQGAAYPFDMLGRLALVLFLVSLGLLPWGGWPSFPWLHPAAQWSDAVFAAAAAAWAADLARQRRWPQFHPAQIAVTGYLGWTVLAFLFADAPAPGSGWKLLGMAELATLALVTADVASRRDGLPWIARVVALTSLATACVAVVATVLFCAGRPTSLLGLSGDLIPGPYPRVRAGFPHPNLLASFSLFAAGVIASDRARLPRWLRRLAAAALALTVLLTLSRTILTFGVAALIRNAGTPSARRRAALFAVVTGLTLVALTAVNLRLDPTRPLDLTIDPAPSPRRQAAVSAFEALTTHPLLGQGPGVSPGRADGVPFDAHFTPLNIASGLGLPALGFFAAIPALLWLRRPRPTDRALWSVLLALGLDALAEDVEDFRHLWVLFGLLAASEPPAEESTDPRQPAPGPDAFDVTSVAAAGPSAASRTAQP